LIMSHFLYRYVRLLLALGFLLSYPAAHAQARAQNILVLGDSISAAYGMSLQQGWVALMAKRLEQDFPDYAIVNASISGDTTGGGLRRLPDLLQRHKPTLVVIELGANDGLRGYPLGSLRRNLLEMVNISQAAGARVVLLPMEIPPNYGSRYTTGFRDTFAAVAAQTDSALAPFIMQGFATDTNMMQADGIHPTVAAQPRLLDNVLPTIIAALDTP